MKFHFSLFFFSFIQRIATIIDGSSVSRKKRKRKIAAFALIALLFYEINVLPANMFVSCDVLFTQTKDIANVTDVKTTYSLRDQRCFLSIPRCKVFIVFRFHAQN